MNLFLKSATLIDASNTSLHGKKRDILIKNGKIEKIASRLEAVSGYKEILLDNLHVSKGWFDSGVCFGEPGFEERETIANGLHVAAASGFADILLNPNTAPKPDSSSHIVFLKERASGQSCNLHPMGTMTARAKGEHLAELFDMQNAGAKAFYDFKTPITNANLLKIALLYAQNFNGLVCSYPMDNHIKGKGLVNEGEVSTKLGLKGIPALAEELQIARDLYILEYTGGQLHIPTVSTAGSVKLIAAAKKKGLNVSCSVALHHLCLTDDVLEEFDTDFKVQPPLRSPKDVKALIKGLENGTIDLVTSDHTPIDIEEKRIEFDNAAFGSIALENSFGVLNKIFGKEKAISLLTKGRKRFNIAEPELKEGALACLALFNPEGELTYDVAHSASTSKNSLYKNMPMHGKVYGSINNGRLVLNP